MKRILIMISLLLITLACHKKETPEMRVDRLGHMIRCPICRGVSIADSPAELAVQMMQIIKDQVAEGKTDEEILKYFEERYGEWALLEPKPQGVNLLIWVFPILFLGGGSLLIFRNVRKREAS